MERQPLLGKDYFEEKLGVGRSKGLSRRENL